MPKERHVFTKGNKSEVICVYTALALIEITVGLTNDFGQPEEWIKIEPDTDTRIKGRYHTKLIGKRKK